MECPICYDAINESTGSTKLSCSHEYHLGCIVSWLCLNQNCPCCRKNINKYETIPIQRTESPRAMDLLNEIEIIGYDTTEDNEYENQLHTFEMIIESAAAQLQLPPHIIRIPVSEYNLIGEPD